MNKREVVLSVFDGGQTPPYVPAAFFLHFAPEHQRGQAAVEKHLEYFRYTDMDFVKIQFEQHFPPMPEIERPADWAKIPVYGTDFFEDPLRIGEGLVKAVKGEALVVQTLYSPFMIAGQIVGGDKVVQHMQENPQAVKRGMAAITESLTNFVRALIASGIDGFYASTQGGEARRFADRSVFAECVKPYDLQLMTETNRGTTFNILHICDYALEYDDLTPFLEYPGQVVNVNLELENGKQMTAQEVERMFGRPFMGGLLRKGILATGTQDQVRAAAREVLHDAPERFILAADCTVPGDTPWDNLRAAIGEAHQSRR